MSSENSPTPQPFTFKRDKRKMGIFAMLSVTLIVTMVIFELCAVFLIRSQLGFSWDHEKASQTFIRSIDSLRGQLQRLKPDRDHKHLERDYILRELNLLGGLVKNHDDSLTLDDFSRMSRVIESFQTIYNENWKLDTYLIESIELDFSNVNEQLNAKIKGVKQK